MSGVGLYRTTLFVLCAETMMRRLLSSGIRRSRLATKEPFTNMMLRSGDVSWTTTFAFRSRRAFLAPHRAMSTDGQRQSTGGNNRSQDQTSKDTPSNGKDSVNAGELDSKEGGENPKDEEGWSIGGYVFLGVVGLIVAYFFKKRGENKEREALADEYDASKIIVPGEINMLRNMNSFMAEDFEVFGEIAVQRFPSGRAIPSEFFALLFADEERADRCFPSLRTNGHVRGGHVLQRLIQHLQQKDSSTTLSVVELLVIASMLVRAGGERRAKALHKILLRKDESVELSKDDEESILVELTDAFVRTFQFPTEMLIAEEPPRIKYVTPHHYHIASAHEKIAEAIVAYEANELNRGDTDLERFIAIMLDRPMCLWGQCHEKASKLRKKEKEERAKA